MVSLIPVQQAMVRVAVVHARKIGDHKFALVVKIKYRDFYRLHNLELLVKISSSRQFLDETNYAVEDKLFSVDSESGEYFHMQ